ncbi:hypothetical protein WH47_08788, partial [Habropoda laboriosa]
APSVLQERHELREFVQLILGKADLAREIGLFFHFTRLHHCSFHRPASFDGDSTSFFQRQTGHRCEHG